MAASGRKGFEVFVSKVPWTAATKEIREYFMQFGHVKKCLLPFNRETGFHKGFCWVAFSTQEGLEKTLQTDSHIIDGTKLYVQWNRKPFGKANNHEAEDI